MPAPARTAADYDLVHDKPTGALVSRAVADELFDLRRAEHRARGHREQFHRERPAIGAAPPADDDFALLEMARATVREREVLARAPAAQLAAAVDDLAAQFLAAALVGPELHDIAAADRPDFALAASRLDVIDAAAREALVILARARHAVARGQAQQKAAAQ